MTVFWIIVGVIVLLISGWLVYNTAEHSELHKMRAGFVEKEYLVVKEYFRQLHSDSIPEEDRITAAEVDKIIDALEDVKAFLDDEESKIDPEILKSIKNFFAMHLK